MKIKIYELLVMACIASGLTGCSPSRDTALTQEKVTTEDASLPYYLDENFIPVWEGESKKITENSHRVKSFEFTDQYGEIITSGMIKGKIHVANFFFSTCPGICPMMINGLKQVQEAFKNDDKIVLLSYTVDPDTDTPDRLKKYATEHNVMHNKWHLLTGKKSDLYKHARSSYFADKDLGIKIEDDFIHTENTFLVDEKGYIRGIYNGTQPKEMERLIEDIRHLK